MSDTEAFTQMLVLGQAYACAQRRAFWLVECHATGSILLVCEPSPNASSESILAVFTPTTDD